MCGLVFAGVLEVSVFFQFHFVLLLAASLIVGDTSVQESSSSDEPGVGLVFESDLVDLGEITDLEPVRFEYRFTNTSDQTITIDRLVQGCNCTSTEIEKKVYEPGESGVIEGMFDPEFRVGSQKKAINLYSDDPLKPIRMLKVFATIKPLVTIEPQFVRLGRVVYKAGATTRFTVSSDLLEMTVDSVKFDGEHVSWELVESERISSDDGTVLHTAEIELGIDPDTPIGTLRRAYFVNMHVTDDSGNVYEHRVNGSVTVYIVGDIDTRPNRLAMKRVSPGESFSHHIRMKSQTGRSFNILDVSHIAGDNFEDPEQSTVPGASSLDIEYETHLVDDVPMMYSFTVRGTTPDEPGRFMGGIVIKTDHPDQPVVTIRYIGVVTQK